MKPAVYLRVMLLALISAFALSQAYRTVAGVMAPVLQLDLGLSSAELGLFAATFHLVFAAAQVFMGAGIDIYGVRRLVLAVFPLAILGGALSALAPDFFILLLGQALIGVGCAPAFIACTVFIAQRYPAERFAAVSGVALGLGSLGMLLTATPLAWLIEISSWRAAFGVLAVLSVGAWLVICVWLRDDQKEPPAAHASVFAVLKGFLHLLGMRHTWGIVLLALTVYASIMALRGLWLGPVLVERHGFTLVQSGDIALVMSILMLLSAPVLGRFDPGTRWRRKGLVVCTIALAALFALLAMPVGDRTAVVIAWVIGALSSYSIWQYADVRASYPTELLGRALGLFTMATFVGVALMQGITGWVANQAEHFAVDPFQAVFMLIAGLLIAGAMAFALLPQPARYGAHGAVSRDSSGSSPSDSSPNET